jgi:hypothetical protein
LVLARQPGKEREMLERPPTWEEVWRARIQAGVLALLTFFVLIWVQWRVLKLNFFVGMGLSPLWNFGSFQLLSRLTTGRSFGFRLDPKARSGEEVFDLLFTVAFLGSLIVGLFVVYDSWTFVAPALVLPGRSG